MASDMEDFFGHGDRLPVQKGAAAQLRLKHLVADGVVVHSHQRPAVQGKAYDDGEVRDAARVVAGAVERVHDPNVPVVVGEARRLLSQHRHVGVLAAQALFDKALGG